MSSCFRSTSSLQLCTNTAETGNITDPLRNIDGQWGTIMGVQNGTKKPTAVAIPFSREDRIRLKYGRTCNCRVICGSELTRLHKK